MEGPVGQGARPGGHGHARARARRGTPPHGRALDEPDVAQLGDRLAAGRLPGGLQDVAAGSGALLELQAMVGGAVRVEPDGGLGEHRLTVEQLELDLAAVGRGELDGNELGPGARLARSVDAEPVDLTGIGRVVVVRLVVRRRGIAHDDGLPHRRRVARLVPDGQRDLVGAGLVIDVGDRVAAGDGVAVAERPLAGAGQAGRGVGRAGLEGHDLADLDRRRGRVDRRHRRRAVDHHAVAARGGEVGLVGRGGLVRAAAGCPGSRRRPRSRRPTRRRPRCSRSRGCS